jgi:hypothetical protein
MVCSLSPRETVHYNKRDTQEAWIEFDIALILYMLLCIECIPIHLASRANPGEGIFCLGNQHSQLYVAISSSWNGGSNGKCGLF